MPFPTLYPVADWTKPTVAQTRQATIDAQRVNLAELRDRLVTTGILQGWDMTLSQFAGGSAEKPDQFRYTLGNEAIAVNPTWAVVAGADAITKLAFYYSVTAGASWLTMTDAAGNYVATITYDGAGNATGITWGTS